MLRHFKVFELPHERYFGAVGPVEPRDRLPRPPVTARTGSAGSDPFPTSPLPTSLPPITHGSIQFGSNLLWCARPEGHMGLIVTLFVFVALAAIIVWIADWASGARRHTALAVLNRRLASGEIDRAEYEEKHELIGR
jgi:Short C-terminal domain